VSLQSLVETCVRFPNCFERSAEILTQMFVDTERDFVGRYR